MTTHSHIGNPCKICGNEVAEIKQGTMASEPYIMRPCPFCGSEFKKYDFLHYRVNHKENCFMTEVYGSPEHWIHKRFLEKWNKRA